MSDNALNEQEKQKLKNEQQRKEQDEIKLDSNGLAEDAGLITKGSVARNEHNTLSAPSEKERKEEKDKRDRDLLTALDQNRTHVQSMRDLINRIKETQAALRATDMLQKLHNIGQLQGMMDKPEVQESFKIAGMNPDKYDPNADDTQFKDHKQTLNEALDGYKAELVALSNSNDPDLQRDSKYQALKAEAEALFKENGWDADFGQDVVYEARKDNMNNTYLEAKDTGGNEGQTLDSDAFLPELKGMAKESFTAAASGFDFGHTMDNTAENNVDQDLDQAQKNPALSSGFNF